MKRIFTIATLALALVGANAQSNTIPSFFSSIGGYFTTHNTNLAGTFGLNKGELWTSVDSIQGNASTAAKLADAVGASYTVYDHLALEGVLRTSGIAGTVVDGQIGPSLNFVLIDVKLTLYADAGYDLEGTHKHTYDALYGELGIRLKKALTEHTYAGVGLGVRVPDASQVYQVMAGFTF